MRSDVLERLRRENPVPDTMSSLPIEPVLRRLEDVPHTGPRRPGLRRGLEQLALGGSVILVLAVAGLAIVLLGNHRQAAKPSSAASARRRPDLQSAPLAQLLASFAVLRREQTKADRSLGPAIRELQRIYERRGGRLLPDLTRRVATLGSGDPLLLTVERARSSPTNLAGERYSLSFMLAIPHGSERLAASYFPVLLRPGVWASVVPDGVARVRWTMSSSSDCNAHRTTRCDTGRSFRVDLPVDDNVAVVRPPVEIGCTPAECRAIHTKQVSWYDANGARIATVRTPAGSASRPGQRFRTPVNGTLTVKGTGIAQVHLTSPNHARLPTGSAEISRNGKRYAVMVVAGGVSPAAGHSVYALWLTGGRRRTTLLGIVSPGVGLNSHRLDAAGPVPADVLSYRRLAITLERSPHPTHPGRVILQGSLPK